MVKVSIGLPVRNGAPFVEEAIRSVLGQSYDNVELIIVDNNSSDGTVDICAKYEGEDSRVKLVQNRTNIGAAPNFNKAFRAASGKYFKWMAADTVIRPGFLDACVHVLDTRPDVALVFSKSATRSEFDGSITHHQSSFDLASGEAYRRFCKLVEGEFNYMLPIWGVMRTEAVRNTKLIQSFIGSDSYFLAEMALLGKFYQVDEHLTMVRRHEDSYTNFKDEKHGVEGEKEAKWLDPNNDQILYLPHWQRLLEYIRLALKSDERAVAKTLMVASVLRLAVGKWRQKLVKELLFALGAKDFYLSLKKLRNLSWA